MPQHIEPNETREEYLERAKSWAFARFNRRAEGRESWTRTLREIRTGALEECQVGELDLATHGVEIIERGNIHCRHSPSILYLNTGDSYGRTIMVVAYRWVVGDWGSIVENGNYNRD